MERSSVRGTPTLNVYWCGLEVTSRGWFCLTR